MPTDGFTWHGDQVTEAVRRAGIGSLRLGAEHILEEANRTVPHDEGTLMRSGFVDVDEEAGVAAISYDTPYAARQHEELSWQHAEGRRAKWLELTVQERQQAVRDYVAQAMKKAMKE